MTATRKDRGFEKCPYLTKGARTESGPLNREIFKFGDRRSEGWRRDLQRPHIAPTLAPGRPSNRLRANKNPAFTGPLSYSGGRIRTCDLRVMSPTSYLAAPPRDGH